MAVNISDFKNFSVLPDVSDTDLQPFLDRAKAFCLRSAGLTAEPDPEDQDFSGAVYLKALALWNERDFPRPQIQDAVNMSVCERLAGVADYTKTLILSEVETQ